MSVTLEIPEDFVQRLQADRPQAEAQLHLELAIALYREGKLPPGRAAELAGLTRWQFEDALRERQVPMPYTVADLEHDLSHAGGRR
jgi:predicted HTH domain antitoxin